MKQRCVQLAIVSTALLACRSAEPQSQPPLAPATVLGGPELAAAAGGPAVRIEQGADGVGLTARLAPGATTGRVFLGPAFLTAGATVLRFTGALSLTGNPECRLSAVFSSGGVVDKPVGFPFSGHAARTGGVFQDVFVPVPQGADSAKIELQMTRAGDTEPALSLRHAYLTSVVAGEAGQPGNDGTAFRHSFSRPDGRADRVEGAASLYPAWSCVLPTAEGKAGPGLRARCAQDAVLFTLPEQRQLPSRGHLTFWLKPLWGQGDARPADMIKLTQGGRSNVLVRKNHGWSFLLVVWDRDGKTHGVSCDLRNLTKGHWTKVEAVWAVEKGLRLIVNGVTLGTSDAPWAASASGAVALRIGQGEHDAKEPAPYVLDEIEVLTRLPKDVFR